MSLINDHQTSSKDFITSYSNAHFQPICVTYMGSIEGAPRKRREWFHSEEDIIQFREHIRNSCPVDKEMVSKDQSI